MTFNGNLNVNDAPFKADEAADESIFQFYFILAVKNYIDRKYEGSEV